MLALLGYLLVVALVPLAIGGFVVAATQAETRLAQHRPKVRRAASAGVFGLAASLAIALIMQRVRGLSFADDYAAPFLLWFVPLAVISAMLIAIVFHRPLTGLRRPGAALAGAAIATLAMLATASITGVIVAPGIKEAFGVALFVLFMLVKAHGLLIALATGSLAALVVNWLEQHARAECDR